MGPVHGRIFGLRIFFDEFWDLGFFLGGIYLRFSGFRIFLVEFSVLEFFSVEFWVAGFFSKCNFL